MTASPTRNGATPSTKACPRPIPTLAGDSSGARLGPFLATAYSQYYPDVKFDDVVRPEARDIARKIADLCQFDPKDVPTLQDLTKQLNGAQVLTDPTAGPFGQHLKENAPDAPIGVPLLIGQGLADTVVYPEVRAAGPDDIRTCVSHGPDLREWE